MKILKRDREITIYLITLMTLRELLLKGFGSKETALGFSKIDRLKKNISEKELLEYFKNKIYLKKSVVKKIIKGYDPKHLDKLATKWWEALEYFEVF